MFDETVFPKEFNQSIRTLQELEHFKASEFRNFLLYAGPVLFKEFLPPAYYNNFLLLHFSVYVFSSSQYHQVLCDNAKAALQKFIAQSELLFGKQSPIYNMHGLCHIPEFVKLHGPLEHFSCFPYENHLSIIKRRIKATRFMFQQSTNLLLKVRDLFSSSDSTHLSFSTASPDNCAMLSNGSIIIIHAISDLYVSGNQLVFCKDLYEIPYPSRHLGIGIYKLVATILSGVPVKKCISFPHGSEFIIIPLVNDDLLGK
jgi:hypothetical protein